MHLIYIDESYDETHFCLSAMLVPSSRWKNCFDQVLDWRRHLSVTEGISTSKELHAVKFVAGRGRPTHEVLAKFHRARIFKETLRTLAGIPDLQLMNAASSKYKASACYEWLANRIQRTMVRYDSHAVMIFDQGNEPWIRKTLRRMRAFNPIPSDRGGWPEGPGTRNIPLERILEDPFFRDSKESHFIQMVDFCAYALLQHERGASDRRKHEIHLAFDLLDPVLFKDATRSDPRYGIIRP